MRVLIVLFVLMILQLSCNNSKKRDLERSFSSYYGKTMQLPIVDPDTLSGFKIVTYIDGDCSKCIKELKRWDEWMARVNSDVDYCFYYHCSDSSTIDYVLDSIARFYHPVIFDKNNKFLNQNSLPKYDKMLQTFLLDSSNRVVLIGNPLFINDLSILYEKELMRGVE